MVGISAMNKLTTFDFIYRAMNKELKNEKDSGESKIKMSYFTNTYINNYETIKKRTI